MTELTGTTGPTELCAGCCGSGVCWVCLGTGLLEMAPGVRVPCHKCAGSACCHVCTEQAAEAGGSREADRKRQGRRGHGRQGVGRHARRAG